MLETQDARRHGDGSIDFDFYRGRSATLRAQAMRDTLLPKRAPKAALFVAAVAIVTFIAAVMPARWI